MVIYHDEQNTMMFITSSILLNLPTENSQQVFLNL